MSQGILHLRGSDPLHVPAPRSSAQTTQLSSGAPLAGARGGLHLLPPIVHGSWGGGATTQIYAAKDCGLGHDTLPHCLDLPFVLCTDLPDPSEKHLHTVLLPFFWAVGPLFSSYFPPDVAGICSHVPGCQSIHGSYSPVQLPAKEHHPRRSSAISPRALTAQPFPWCLLLLGLPKETHTQASWITYFLCT